jgi:serine/threonine protein phosphatase PrpC
MQGWRIGQSKSLNLHTSSTSSVFSAMEDAHVAVLDLDETEDSGNTFFAVYDGHGGSSCPSLHSHYKLKPCD